MRSPACAAPAATFAAFAFAACQSSVTTPFPAGLEPFEDADTPGTLPEIRQEALQTSGRSDDIIRAYGRGFIFGAPAAVWAAAKVPEAMAARCNTSSQTYMLNNEPQHELSFLVHYVVNDLLTVEWDDQWRGDVIEGASATPDLVMIKHQKVQGSSFIKRSDGSIQLFATDNPNLTELWFVEHLDAISGSTADVVGGMKDNFDAMAAVVRGQPIPPCS